MHNEKNIICLYYGKDSSINKTVKHIAFTRLDYINSFPTKLDLEREILSNVLFYTQFNRIIKKKNFYPEFTEIFMKVSFGENWRDKFGIDKNVKIMGYA